MVMRAAVIVVAVFGIVALRHAQSTGGDRQVRPVLTYQISSPVSEHQPVVLSVQLLNPTSNALTARLGRNYVGNFHLVLQTPDGVSAIAEPGALSGAGGLSSRGDIRLEPGQTYSGRVILSRWLKFDQLGVYTLHIHFDGEIRQDSSDGSVQRDGTVVVSVVPRNEAVLTATCERLLSVIRTGATFEAKYDAAVELSFVVDPVAVSYFKQLIEADQMVDELAIVGLERVGNAEARKVLERALINRHPETAQAARDALNRLDAKVP
jgi:hypothetical protein